MATRGPSQAPLQAEGNKTAAASTQTAPQPSAASVAAQVTETCLRNASLTRMKVTPPLIRKK
jgi:hypothetical protein